MEVSKHKTSGKYFIYIQDVGSHKALFVTPQAEIQSRKLDSFEEMEDMPENDLLVHELITKSQLEKLAEYRRDRVDERIEDFEEWPHSKQQDLIAKFQSLVTNEPITEALKSQDVISFMFRVNDSFLNYLHRPITIPRGQVDYTYIEAANLNLDDLKVICHNGEIMSGKIVYSKAGYGPYYQICIEGAQNDPLSRLPLGTLLIVHLKTVGEVTELRLYKA